MEAVLAGQWEYVSAYYSLLWFQVPSFLRFIMWRMCCCRLLRVKSATPTKASLSQGYNQLKLLKRERERGKQQRNVQGNLWPHCLFSLWQQYFCVALLERWTFQLWFLQRKKIALVSHCKHTTPNSVPFVLCTQHLSICWPIVTNNSTICALYAYIPLSGVPDVAAENTPMRPAVVTCTDWAICLQCECWQIGLSLMFPSFCLFLSPVLSILHSDPSWRNSNAVHTCQLIQRTQMNLQFF